MHIPYVGDEAIYWRGEKRKALLAGFLRWALERVSSASDGCQVDELSVSDAGVHLSIKWDVYCRGHFMETQWAAYTIPWGVFFSDLNLSVWVEQENARREAEEAAKRKDQEEQRQRDAVLAAEARDRAEYERLRAKFEGK